MERSAVGGQKSSVALGLIGLLVTGCSPASRTSTERSHSRSLTHPAPASPGDAPKGPRIRPIDGCANTENAVTLSGPLVPAGGTVGVATGLRHGDQVSTVSWRGDIDGDGREDAVLVLHEQCGNYGECPFTVLRHCKGNEYQRLWGPEYAVEVRVTTDSHAGSRDLVLVTRGEEAGRATAIEQILRRGPNGYGVVR